MRSVAGLYYFFEGQRILKHIYLLLFLSYFILILNPSSAFCIRGDISMAVSPSIYDSGITGYFIPLFEKKMPYRLRAIPASNEEAIVMARRG